MVGNQTIELQPGEFIFGRKRWAEALGMPEKKLRNCVRNASDMRSNQARLRAIKRASKYTVYKIINWELYQPNETQEGQQVGHEVGQQKGQQGASKGPHYKNVKNYKNKSITVENDFEIDIYEFYLKTIRPENKTRSRALKNLIFHLKSYSFEALKTSVKNYEPTCKKREPHYRKDPANFFGRQEPAFIDYLPENFDASASQDQANENPYKEYIPYMGGDQ